MSGINKHILIGHLGKDPESRPLTGGGQVVTFSLAATENWRDKATGEKRQQTSWHNVVIYNEPLGKIALEYLHKGSQVYLEGEVITREYEQNGAKRRVTETVLKAYRGALTLLDRAERAPGPTGSESPAGPLDDEVPF